MCVNTTTTYTLAPAGIPPEVSNTCNSTLCITTIQSTPSTLINFLDTIQVNITGTIDSFGFQITNQTSFILNMISISRTFITPAILENLNYTVLDPTESFILQKFNQSDKRFLVKYELLELKSSGQNVPLDSSILNFDNETLTLTAIEQTNNTKVGVRTL